MSMEIASPGRVLPTLPGKTAGVVWSGEKTHSRQCAACLRVFTDLDILVGHAVNFRADTGNDRSGMPRLLSYPRCAECRTAHQHP